MQMQTNVLFALGAPVASKDDIFASELDWKKKETVIPMSVGFKHNH